MLFRSGRERSGSRARVPLPRLPRRLDQLRRRGPIFELAPAPEVPGPGGETAWADQARDGLRLPAGLNEACLHESLSICCRAAKKAARARWAKAKKAR